MYALFLETKACEQIDRYVAANGGDADDIKQKCYDNARKYLSQWRGDRSDQAGDDWWVKLCLKHDSHKKCDVDSLMYWHETPEGQEFWSRVNDY